MLGVGGGGGGEVGRGTMGFAGRKSHRAPGGGLEGEVLESGGGVVRLAAGGVGGVSGEGGGLGGSRGEGVVVGEVGGEGSLGVSRRSSVTEAVGRAQNNQQRERLNTQDKEKKIRNKQQART